MKTLLFPVLVFISSAISGTAQSVVLSKTHTSSNSYYLPEIIGESATSIYVFNNHYSEEKTQLEIYDKKGLSLEYTVPLSLPAIKDFKSHVKKVVYLGDKTFVFAGYYSKKLSAYKMIPFLIDEQKKSLVEVDPEF